MTSVAPIERPHFATMPDGCRIAYGIVPAKRRSSARIALVHSLAMDGSFWSALAPHLDADVLVVDCRGHGRSDKPAGPYTVEQDADDLAAVMDAAGWTKAVVAGASMGGCISIAFAARHPQKTSGLGLIDTTAWYGADAPSAWEERGRQGMEKGLQSLLAFQSTRWVSDAFRTSHPEVVEAAQNVFVANEPRAYLETCRMLGAADLRGVLKDIHCPVRIMVGSEDYATPPAMAEAMHAALPQSTLRVLDGVRHLTPLECPARVAEELAPLLVHA